jgi:hypothetical protein
MIRHKLDPGANIEETEGNGEYCEYIFGKPYHMRS